jgi:hypothetical protein
MKQKQDIERRVDQTLDSLDGLQRAEPAPWLYARIQARLQREEKSPWATISGFLAKPIVAFAGLCLILAVNVFFLVSEPKETAPVSIAGQNETMPESESIIASNSSFEYENLVQP